MPLSERCSRGRSLCPSDASDTSPAAAELGATRRRSRREPGEGSASSPLAARGRGVKERSVFVGDTLPWSPPVSPLRFFGPHPSQGSSPAPSPLQWCRFCRRPFGPLSAALHGRRLALGEGEPRSTFARSAGTAVTPAAQRLWDPAHAARFSNCGPRLLRRLVAVNADGRAGWGCGAAVKGRISRDSLSEG